MKKNSNKKNNTVFIAGFIFVLAIVVWGLALPNNFEFVANLVSSFFSTNFGWFYILSMTAFIVFTIWLGFFSDYGDVVLGDEGDEPEFSRRSWFAMLFSAGMGIGLVFYGAAEPMAHYLAPARGIDPGTLEAAQFAMEKSLTHWGLHPWANYSVLALGLAIMHYKRKQPLLVSSLFVPLIGEERARGPIGNIADILAIFATIAGMATSLGLGTYQINSGLNHLWGVPQTPQIQIAIVLILTVIFIWTAVSGVEKGIAAISNINLVLVVVLLTVSFLVGPTVGVLNNFVQSTGYYLQNIIFNSTDIGAFDPSDFYANWTIYYWGWWISWAPFTGLFIARISKGRTIREFVSGVLMVPVTLSIFWFALFSQLGFNLDLSIVTEAAQDVTTTLFVILSEYPLGAFLNIVAVILLFTFFITSANSATFVLGMLSEHGNPEPSNGKKVVWGLLQSGVALALMIGSVNGLQMLQNISITAALPFTIVMIIGMFSLVKVLREEVR